MDFQVGLAVGDGTVATEGTSFDSVKAIYR
jgi:hypothetical protein